MAAILSEPHGAVERGLGPGSLSEERRVSETQVLLAGVLSGRCVLQEQLNRASAPTIGTQRENELVSLIRFSSFNSTNKILQPISARSVRDVKSR